LRKIDSAQDSNLRPLDFRSTALVRAVDHWLESSGPENQRPQGQILRGVNFFTMLISCSRCSDGFMWLPFW